MRLHLHIKNATQTPWEKIISTRPDSLRAERHADEVVLYRAAKAATGVRLSRREGAHVVSLPAFASVDEMSMARGLVEEVAKLTNGTIVVSGHVVPRDAFVSLFDEQIAPKLGHACLDTFAGCLVAPPREVFAVEGVRRPYYIGKNTAAHIAAIAGDDGIYEKVVSIVESIQQLGQATHMPRPFTIRMPSGDTVTCAIWDPRRETLTPPLDYLFIRESATVKIRVPLDRIADVLTLPGRTAVLGAPIDEFQWLLGAQGDPTVRGLIEHARGIGTHVEMPDA